MMLSIHIYLITQKDGTYSWVQLGLNPLANPSHFIAQKLIIKALNDKEGRRILVCRKTANTIRETVWRNIVDMLNFFQITDRCNINKTERVIKLPNGSEFIFQGLDEETKLLSLTNISDIWVEESYECSYDIVSQLNLRMRGNAENQQLYLSFNPISKSSWLYPFCTDEEKQPKSFFYHHSTYRDNKFLPKAYVEEMQDIERTNPQKAQVYCYGLWGTPLEGIVFPNHKVQAFDIDEMLKNRELQVMCGCDLGYVDASTVVMSLWDKPNKKIYIIKEYYETRATLDEVVAGMKAMGIGKLPVYVDSAEPRSIQYFSNLGINAKPSKKSNSSNKLYIQFLQNHEIIIHPTCEHVIEEFDNFSYVKNKVTGEYDDDKFTHEWSHTIDALKYSYSNVYKNNKIKSYNWKLRHIRSDIFGYSRVFRVMQRFNS